MDCDASFNVPGLGRERYVGLTCTNLGDAQPNTTRLGTFSITLDSPADALLGGGAWTECEVVAIQSEPGPSDPGARTTTVDRPSVAARAQIYNGAPDVGGIARRRRLGFPLPPAPLRRRRLVEEPADPCDPLAAIFGDVTGDGRFDARDVTYAWDFANAYAAFTANASEPNPFDGAYASLCDHRATRAERRFYRPTALRETTRDTVLPPMALRETARDTVCRGVDRRRSEKRRGTPFCPQAGAS